MMRASRLLVCAGLSVAAHLALATCMQHLPKRAQAAKRIVSVRIMSPPPAAEPPSEPTAAPQAPVPMPAVRHVRSRVKPPPDVAPERQTEDVPSPERPEPTSVGSIGPVFGVTIESTSQAGSGPALPVGHTSGGGMRRNDNDNDGHGGAKGVALVVPAYAVTTMPMPQGRCEGKYTPQALRAAIEGTVILDVVIGETGRVREVRVVSGLGDGLTEAAVSAVKGCRFSPGEKDGKPVPVRIQGYKIRFLLPTDE